MKRHLFVSVLIIALCANVLAQNTGYRIEVNIDGIKDTTLLLGYHFGSKKYVTDTAMVDPKGHAIFTDDTLLHGGIYFVVLPEKQYFEFLVSDDQDFGITVKRDDLIGSLQFTGCKENSTFASYQRFMVDMQEQNKTLTEKMKEAANDEKVKEELKEQFKTLNNKVEANWDRLIAENPNTLLAAMIKAMRPISIPEFTIPEGISKPDSARWAMSYNYNRAHYFDNIDLHDSRLIRTPILEQRIDNYLDRVLLPQPDSIISASIRLIEMTKGDKQMFQYMLQHLSNKFQTSDRMGMDGVFATIAEKYYLSGEAWWADPKFIDKIRERVEDIKPNMIGKVAPDLELPDEKMQYIKLSDIKAKITVLYFWDVDCGHCKKVTPEMKKLYTKYKSKGLEVVGIYTQGDQPKWMEYTQTHELNWINLWRPNVGTDFRKPYNITATPVIYVLDANKHIIAKRISHETLDQILETELGK